MLNVIKIDNVLIELVLNKRYKFNAKQVAYLTGESDLRAVHEYLKSKTPYICELYNETICPHCNTAKYSKTSSGDKVKNSVLNKKCPHCKEKYEVNRDTILLTFIFNEEYIKQIREKGDTNEE